MTDPSWEGAECVMLDGDDFFPDKGKAPPEAAVAACKACLLSETCLEYALSNRVVGYWGGTTDAQRSTILRRRQRARKRLKDQAAAATA